MSLFSCLSGSSLGRYCRKSLAKSERFGKKTKRGMAISEGGLSIKWGSSNLLHTMTFHWLLQVHCIAQKMHISEYICKNFLEELTFLCRGTFEKLLQTVAFLHMLLFHRLLLHFQILFQLFQSISTSHFGTIKIQACFYKPN